ncbi:hypothetical protein O8I39_06510, partial [Campylobacter lari]
MSRVVVSNRTDGFGARIQAILNGLFVSKKTNSKFYFTWKIFKNQQTNKKILLPFENLETHENIFSDVFLHSHYIEDNYYDDFINLSKINISQILSKTQYDSNILVNTPGDMRLFIENKYINEYKESCIATWREFFSFDKKKVITIARKEALRIGNFIAIHIRAGDIIHNDGNPHLNFHKATNIALVDKIILMKENINIVLFGDDLDILSFFKNKFNSKNIIIAPDFHIYYKLTQVSQIIFDIELMSCANEIYASGKSCFSNLASLLSCNQIFFDIYSIYSKTDMINIILNFLRDNHIPNNHRAFMNFYLYVLNNKTEDAKNYLIYSHRITDFCSYKIEYINFLLNKKMLCELEEYLSKIDGYILLNLLRQLFRKRGKQYVYNSTIKLFEVNSSFQNISFIAHLKNQAEKNDRMRNLLNIQNGTINLLFFQTKYGTAKTRIQNQLSYKLGQAMIVNSKSILGYIRMPFV